ALLRLRGNARGRGHLRAAPAHLCAGREPGRRGVALLPPGQHDARLDPARDPRGTGHHRYTAAALGGPRGRARPYLRPRPGSRRPRTKDGEGSHEEQREAEGRDAGWIMKRYLLDIGPLGYSHDSRLTVGTASAIMRSPRALFHGQKRAAGGTRTL